MWTVGDDRRPKAGVRRPVPHHSEITPEALAALVAEAEPGAGQASWSTPTVRRPPRRPRGGAHSAEHGIFLHKDAAGSRRHVFTEFPRVPSWMP
jgi:hypothetical protein